MDKNLEAVVSEVDRDLSTEWLALTQRVRSLTAQIHTDAPSVGTRLLVDEVSNLCDHVDRMHRDVAELLSKLDDNLPVNGIPPVVVEASEVEKEGIQIQRESHEFRADFKDILKALFMWQDDPIDRVRDKKS